MNKQRTILLVLKRGKDFGIEDVDLITSHIHSKWKSEIKPRIIVLMDGMSKTHELVDYEIHPLTNDYPGTWSRMQLYSPMMDEFRPFLYIDLDTAIIQSLENIFDLVTDESKFITLEDFWQPKQLATGLVWFPSDVKKTSEVWTKWLDSNQVFGFRMDNFLRQVVKPDLYWQQITNTVHDFKPKKNVYLNEIPENANLICFHGKPRIRECSVEWVKKYAYENN